MSAVTRRITQQQLLDYADASGDHNPIHIDPAFAAATPFGGTIAHGMLILATIGELMHNLHGEAWLATGQLKVRFKAPTRPGDTVTATAEQTKESGGRIEYAVRCTNQHGEILVDGRASVAEAA